LLGVDDSALRRRQSTSVPDNRGQAVGYGYFTQNGLIDRFGPRCWRGRLMSAAVERYNSGQPVVVWTSVDGITSNAS
jgi:hypothetical protein